MIEGVEDTNETSPQQAAGYPADYLFFKKQFEELSM
jgi:hypothetical protein